MGKYTVKFLKQTLVLLAFSILFIAWQTHQNPEGTFIHYLFGCFLFLMGVLINGFLAVLSAIEDKQKKKESEEEDGEEDKKEILKG